RRGRGESCSRTCRTNSKAPGRRKSRSCERNFASDWNDYRRNKSKKCEKNFVNGQSGSKTKERLSASNLETRQARTRKIANERPRSKLRYQKNIYESFPEVVTPECFNRGSSQSFAGFPVRACGNDEL